MPSFFQVSALAALAVGTLAIPMPETSEGFTVPRVAVSRGRSRPTLMEMNVKTKLKFNRHVSAAEQAAADTDRLNAISRHKPSGTKSSSSSSQTGSVVANAPVEDGDDDEEYLCSVQVGGNTLNLDFDTGSSDLWVYSTLQPKSEQKGHNVYDVSHGKKVNNEYWNITYEDASYALGTVYVDKVVIGGVTVTSQIVEAATTVSAAFVNDTNNDGLVGFAFTPGNTVQIGTAPYGTKGYKPDPQKTWFDNVRSTLKQPLFAAALKHGPNDPGSYDFGFLNSKNYQGSINYTAVNNTEAYWGVGSSPNGPILDTGTTLVYYDDAAVNAYYKAVKGAKYSKSAGGFIFPCSTTFTKDFPVKVNTLDSLVEAQYINYGVNDPTVPDVCFGGIQRSSDAGDFAVLGDVFLKGKYVVFEYPSNNKPRAGIAWQPGHGPSRN